MPRLALALALALLAPFATGADLDYKAGSKLRVVLTSGVTCDMRVVDRQQDQIVVAPRKAKSGCPTGASLLPLDDVVRIEHGRSRLRSFGHITLGVFVICSGVSAALQLAPVGGGIAIGGSVALAVVIFKSGYRWTGFLNRAELEPAPAAGVS